LIDHVERREQLAEAAWRVILRDGVAGASVRTVAAEAGHSTGSLRHVFSTQSQLLVFALELVVERVVARIDALPPLATPRETVEAVAAELLPLDRERRAEMEVYLALFTAAGANAELRASREAAHRQMREANRWMITQLDNGADLPADADLEYEAIRLHAVIDGLAAQLIYEPADRDPEWARQVLIHHIRSLSCTPPAE
jgi:AcrR family transcriptional regulator